jgi:putative CocE/NonD family hydrolase
MKMPGKEAVDTYVYDPENPVPSHGGNNLVGATAGPYDQQKIEERDDVLVFTSEELKEPLEVTGPVKLMLYAASSATDTDFNRQIDGVNPDGRATISAKESFAPAIANHPKTSVS